MDKQIESLMDLHYAFRFFLNKKDAETVNFMMNRFNEESDVNEIKTILIITKAFAENPDFKTNRARLLGILEARLAKITYDLKLDELTRIAKENK